MVRVEISFDFHGRSVVVPVEALALVALVADEVSRAEDQVVLGDAHLVSFSHGGTALRGHDSRSQEAERRLYRTLAESDEQASGYHVGGRPRVTGVPGGSQP